jgi:hypothetical protein
MGRAVRQLVIGLIALGVLLGVFLLYTRLNGTPPVALDVRAAPPELQTDADAGAERIGTIFGTDVRRVEQTQFFHTNEHSQVDREFGFEELLHKRGDQWEITRPYMRVFLPAFRCDVTADRGKVRLETAFGRATPSDADFSGNVIIHIVPTEPNDPWESFLRLDNVGFVAEQSLFSTRGPVQFLSRNARLAGTGLEMIYDGLRSRLELFRIFALGSLELRSSAFRSVADLTAGPGSAGTAPAADAKQQQVRPNPNEPGSRYDCVFRRNVRIRTPERVVAARDVLAIHGILWSQAATGGAAARHADPNDGPPPAAMAAAARYGGASSYRDLESIPPESFDIVVTCDGGLVLAPVDGGPTAGRALTGDAPAPPRRDTSDGGSHAAAPAPDGQHMTAGRIDFDAATKDTTLAGPVEMMFYLDPNALRDEQTGRGPTPMTVTAQQSVRFLAAPNQVLLEGDCTAGVCRSEPNLTLEYLLAAPRFTLEVAADPNAAGVRVRRFLTQGGPANLRIFRRGPDRQLLGWTKLDAAQLQYDADPREFTALGPGVLWVHNAEVLDARADPNRFSLGRPCYASVTNFDRLTYAAATGRISAAARSRQLVLDYFPLTATGYDRHVQAVAGRVEARLREVAAGRMELAEMTASDGIDFEDEKYHFVGSVLVYDHSRSLVIVRGDAVQPCLFNGARVDQIEMNLKTGSINAPISTPGVIQFRR